MRDIVFNELSLQPLPTDFVGFEQRMAIFMNVWAILKRQYKFKKVVFVQNLEAYQVLTDMSFKDYLYDKRTNRNYKDLVVDMRVYPSDEEENQQEADKFVMDKFLVTTTQGKQSCDGLAIAYLHNKLFISLISDVLWENIRITIEVSTDEGTFTKQVLNLSKPDHLTGTTDITRWIVANVQASIAVVEDLKTLYPNYIFEKQAFEDLMYWKAKDTQIYEKLHTLLRDVELNPFTGGLGQTEVLKNLKDSRASKRINQEDRLVYWLEGKDADKKITIYSCKGHY